MWQAIAAKEVEGIVARPLDTAPAYWQRFVAARGGLPSATIRHLYMEARELLRAGFRASETLERAGTTGIWEALLPYLFRTDTVSLPHPPSWDDDYPSLAGT